MRCDLHVHSWHSGMCFPPPFRGFCRESYSQPEDVYRRLKRRGMDLVTLTDHDSIDGAEALRRYPDFFASEEVTCRLPSGTTIHAGVYDVSERQHIEIQRRRDDFPSLAAYLEEQRLFFSLHHFFSGLTGSRKIEDFGWCESHFPALETRNGHVLPSANRHAALLAQRMGKARVGGSDGHTLASLGATYTWVPGTRNKTEFLEGLRRGLGRPRGESGGYFKLTLDALRIAREMMREQPLTAILAPLMLLLPVATLVNYMREFTLAQLWWQRWTREEPFRSFAKRRGRPEVRELWA
ncbi:MAG TPA: PHP domain-containing protein [Terriglobia bacterium]|nr:PHP domain-containing protein [Terriglobia bacterium]